MKGRRNAIVLQFAFSGIPCEYPGGMGMCSE